MDPHRRYTPPLSFAWSRPASALRRAWAAFRGVPRRWADSRAKTRGRRIGRNEADREIAHAAPAQAPGDPLAVLFVQALTKEPVIAAVVKAVHAGKLRLPVPAPGTPIKR